ncbi:uncharacterized protein PV09_01211 [Verruconis gallopava]|uniref:F-box domain-containing protein n=1 Tax=Verruconis gallopava TaxID=253628 RepID=A0A0D2ANI5_9PEZI|nr:uncharacterized protein PV09_01211 [Verruconis gallopava]KIW08293.1 hypothetical protein PV09_01211 [Verruconis gallopava]
MSRKRVKRTSKTDNGHIGCQLHNDDEIRKTRCNGLQKSGQRCRYKVNRAAAEALIADGYLPVCGVHREQHIYRGYCEATAECGERCNRLVICKPPENQLCEDHEEVQLTCHIMKLPTELRLMIFDLLIPEGDISFHNTGNGLSSTAALLRVNKQISNEVASLFFGSAKRTCVIQFPTAWPRGVSAGTLYSTRFLDFLPIDTSSLAKSSVYRFRHFEINIKLGYALMDDCAFYEFLEGFQRMLYCVQRPHAGSTTSPFSRNVVEGQHTVTNPEQTRSCRVKYSFDSNELSWGDGGMPDWSYPEEIFAVVRAVQGVLVIVDFEPIVQHETVVLRYGSGSLHSSDTKFVVTKDKVLIEGAGAARTFEKRVDAARQSLKNAWSNHTIRYFQSTSAVRWQMFEKIRKLCTAFYGMDIAKNDIVSKSTVCREDIRFMYEQATNAHQFIAAARYALACLDTGTLARMLRDLRDFWQTYCRCSVTALHESNKAVYDFFQHPEVQTPYEEIRNDTFKISKPKLLSWPIPRFRCPFLGGAEIEYDGLFESCRVNGVRFYQPLTPRKALERYRELEENEV